MYGLKGKVKETILSMDRRRNNKQRPEDIGLRAFMAETYQDSNGNPLGPEHLYSELGIDPRYSTVKELMDDPDTAYLMPEIIRDGIRMGMGLAQRERLATMRENLASLAPVTADGGRQRFMSPEVFLDPVMLGAVEATWYPDLIIREEPVSQPTVTMPLIDLSDAKLKDSGEAVTIEEGTVTYDSKEVKLKKKARGLKTTYESIMFNSLSLAQIFFIDLGRMLGQQLNGMAVDTIVDGDQADLSENAAVIGVEDTEAGITWRDLARVAIQLSLLGRNGMQAIGNATTALDYIDLDEVKQQFFGSAILQTKLKTPLTMPETLYVSTKVPASQLVINDPSLSLVQLTAMPLMLETEKIVSKQLNGTYASIFTGFAKVMRTASLVIDGSISYTGHEFPAWMQPWDED